jgi:hypothetical protein
MVTVEPTGPDCGTVEMMLDSGMMVGLGFEGSGLVVVFSSQISVVGSRTCQASITDTSSGRCC